MFQNDKLAVLFVSFYLLIYCELLQYDKLLGYATLMLLISPFLVVWMVYTVIKLGKYLGPELGEKEFGYQDKNSDELGIF